MSSTYLAYVQTVMADEPVWLGESERNPRLDVDRELLKNYFGQAAIKPQKAIS